MRCLSLPGLVVIVALCANPAEAGLYNPAEPWERMLRPLPGQATDPRVDFSSFLIKHADLRNIGIQEPTGKEKVFQQGASPPMTPVRLRYSLVADLSPRLAPSTWPTDKKISLSAYLIRRGKHREAIEVLRSIRDRSNFLVGANLGTAYQLDGEDATDYLDQAVATWPRSWTSVDKEMKTFLEQMGWNEGTFLWYREAEKYHLKLVKLRAREARGRPRNAGVPETLDKLFDVDFTYVGGKIAEKEKAKIPANALAIVQQLLIWLPDDPRLYWLLGELYHARETPEDVAAARQIFKDLADFNGRFRVAEIRDHWRALGPATPTAPNVALENEPAAAPPDDKANAVFDLRPVLVGFGAGVLVSLLGYWQIREIRRRRLGK
jgi:hypothetical protein